MDKIRTNPDKSGHVRICPDLNTNEKIENSKTKVFLKFKKLKSNPGKIFTDFAESASIAQEMEKTEILDFFYVKKIQTEMDGTSDFKGRSQFVLHRWRQNPEYTYQL